MALRDRYNPLLRDLELGGAPLTTPQPVPIEERRPTQIPLSDIGPGTPGSRRTVPLGTPLAPEPRPRNKRLFDQFIKPERPKRVRGSRRRGRSSREDDLLHDLVPTGRTLVLSWEGTEEPTEEEISEAFVHAFGKEGSLFQPASIPGILAGIFGVTASLAGKGSGTGRAMGAAAIGAGLGETLHQSLVGKNVGRLTIEGIPRENYFGWGELGVPDIKGPMGGPYERQSVSPLEDWYPGKLETFTDRAKEFGAQVGFETALEGGGGLLSWLIGSPAHKLQGVAMNPSGPLAAQSDELTPETQNIDARPRWQQWIPRGRRIDPVRGGRLPDPYVARRFANKIPRIQWVLETLPGLRHFFDVPQRLSVQINQSAADAYEIARPVFDVDIVKPRTQVLQEALRAPVGPGSEKTPLVDWIAQGNRLDVSNASKGEEIPGRMTEIIDRYLDTDTPFEVVMGPRYPDVPPQRFVSTERPVDISVTGGATRGGEQTLRFDPETQQWEMSSRPPAGTTTPQVYVESTPDVTTTGFSPGEGPQALRPGLEQSRTDITAQAPEPQLRFTLKQALDDKRYLDAHLNLLHDASKRGEGAQVDDALHATRAIRDVLASSIEETMIRIGKEGANSDLAQAFVVQNRKTQALGDLMDMLRESPSIRMGPMGLGVGAFGLAGLLGGEKAGGGDPYLTLLGTILGTSLGVAAGSPPLQSMAARGLYGIGQTSLSRVPANIYRGVGITNPEVPYGPTGTPHGLTEQEQTEGYYNPPEERRPRGRRSRGTRRRSRTSPSVMEGF